MSPVNPFSCINVFRRHRASSSRNGDAVELPASLNMTMPQLERMPEIRRWLSGSVSELHNRQLVLRRMIEFRQGSLDISNLNISSLPKNFGQLVNIEHLNINGNNLRELPESIGQLLNLRRLEVKGNNLRKLPRSIGQLSNLEVLDIRDNNALGDLPPMVGRVRIIRCDSDLNNRPYDGWENSTATSMRPPSSRYQTPRTVGFQIQSNSLQELFATAITNWVGNSPPNENRREAAPRILEAFNTNSPQLDLRRLSLTPV